MESAHFAGMASDLRKIYTFPLGDPSVCYGES